MPDRKPPKLLKELVVTGSDLMLLLDKRTKEGVVPISACAEPSLYTCVGLSPW